MRRNLFFGDRYWSDTEMIDDVMVTLCEHYVTFIVVEGEAPGADSLSRAVAEKYQLPVDPFPAKWEVTDQTPSYRIRRRRDGTLYDCAAGPIRNEEMLDSGLDEAHGFHRDLTKSKGTLDMLGRLEKADVWVQMHPYDTRPGKQQITMEV